MPQKKIGGGVSGGMTFHFDKETRALLEQEAEAQDRTFTAIVKDRIHCRRFFWNPKVNQWVEEEAKKLGITRHELIQILATEAIESRMRQKESGK
jgi:hypothetical protein